MGRPARSRRFHDGVPGLYHVTARCVRRAFFFGRDPVSGRDYSDRREWIRERLELLAECFFIDIGFLALMVNHLHLVLRTSPRLARRVSREEIARRWLRVYPGKRVLDGNWIEPTEEQVRALAADAKKIKRLRKRLANPSWFMKALNEYIARRANLEDQTSGRFWEGRFNCRELRGEHALLVCGLYVDLNQIRAGEVTRPEDCLSSSVGYRISGLRQSGDQEAAGREPRPDGWLAELTWAEDPPEGADERTSVSGRRATDRGLLRLTTPQYLEMLDYVGREARADKPGKIPDNLPPILERLGIKPTGFVDAVLGFAGKFRRFVGSAAAFTEHAREQGRRHLHGKTEASRVFQSP